MNNKRRAKLEAAGWKVGDASDFLQLSPEERELVEVRLRLSRAVRGERERLQVTQQALAERLGSSQSRVAKIEAGDASVSLDLMVRALFSLGADRRRLAGWLGAG